MPQDNLKDARDQYDVVIVGSGLAALTAANTLGRSGRSVLLLEQHDKLGGLATWFRRRGGHIFDVSLHGFPAGMIKSCRRYWNDEIAGSIVQLKNIRFDNPAFSLTTTYDRSDFTRLLVERFHIPAATVEEFLDAARKMNFYDDQTTTTGGFLERFFPGREDLLRLVMEPITFANGSTLEDPALTYGIVFSNFISKGVYTFQGGTDRLIGLMAEELQRNGVDARTGCDVQQIRVSNRRIEGVTVDGRFIKARGVLSNANLKGTIFNLVGEEHWDGDFLEQAREVRLNNSSTQVYLALHPGEMIDESCGDLLFSSTASIFRTELLLDRRVTSRTYSFYYPKTRPGSNRCLLVASANARYSDWAGLSHEEYETEKQKLIESTLDHAERYVPNIRARLDWSECSTPITFERFTRHLEGASFGTKFEGLAVSRAMPQQIAGLYHAGSVGIIMSGWLGAVNYGVIVANDIDAYLMHKT
jgi:phytoene dehydrogenase-like protein